MRKLYLVVYLFITTATSFSMEIPDYSSTKHEEDNNNIYSEFKDIPKEKKLEKEIAIFRGRWRKIDTKNTAIQTLTLKLKKSESVAEQWNTIEEAMLEAFQKNPLFFQEHPFMYEIFINALESGANEHTIQCWLAEVQKGHKKLKSKKIPIIKSVLIKGTTIKIAASTAYDLILKPATVSRDMRGLHQAVVVSSLLGLALQQKKSKKTLDYLDYITMAPIMSTVSYFACKSLKNMNFINKDSAKKFIHFVAGTKGSQRRKISDYVACSLAVISTLKWMWDLSDETYRELIKHQAIETYETKIVQPLQSLKAKLCNKPIQHQNSSNSDT